MPEQAAPRFLLVGIQPRSMSDSQAFGPWRELWQLVESFGGEVVDVIIQKREVHDKGMYIGSGKLAEIQRRIGEERIDVVALLDSVKPGQLYEMKEQLATVKPEVEVWDRVDLILHIFAQHAHTAEARLQIELATMRHMGPRIFGMGIEMSRQGGGIGTRGIGETNTERMKRHWAAQMKKVEDKLDKMAGSRERQLVHRRRMGMRTVSLIGYTNAGKTSLYNRLVGKQKFSRNMLFATLDASVGKVFLPPLTEEVLVSDTIGFIQGLPPELLEAFKSTLMETIFADVLVEVIDVTDPDIDQKIAVVERILVDLRLTDRRRLFVFNKMDAADVEIEKLRQKYGHFHPQFVSAENGAGMAALLEQLGEELVAATETVGS